MPLRSSISPWMISDSRAGVSFCLSISEKEFTLYLRIQVTVLAIEQLSFPRPVELGLICLELGSADGLTSDLL